MSIFVDTGVFYAHHDRSSPRHDAAAAAMRELLAGRYGKAFTSDYVFDETVTLTLSRTSRVEAARKAGERIRGAGDYPDVVSLLFVSSDCFERAVAAFDRFDDHALSFTDATTVALVEERNIDAVLSFDDDFDGLVERVDPITLAE
ncbi:type II toxin-antitoxin system VapC family toxin [Natronoarchaeum rubrum]|uniref:type II toxin-antitoxin system VapC family toxin n=1 Tax=Natronoarchaeum rubrum TaxID=755311 RepID=UPI0021131EE4|nr:PIN domain-containing protein [Natronoarchaeum rubrum]HMB49502.1 PIN domain-containing protein [Natronoarchaeum rubrum]